MELQSGWQSALASTLDVDDAKHRDRYYSFAVTGICIILVSFTQIMRAKRLKVDVPLEGSSSGLISSYLAAYEFIGNSKSILKNAYKKYSQGTFKIPGLDRYTVIINSHDLIEEVRKAPDDKISFAAAMSDLVAARWTIGENLAKDDYHLHAIRNQLTRSLGLLFDDVQDEITQAFGDLIPAKNGGIAGLSLVITNAINLIENCFTEWVAVSALETTRNIVCRASNRIFVGTPLCRDLDYIDLNITFAVDVSKTVFKISKVPGFLRPIVGAFISSAPRNVHRGMKHLRPLFEERFRLYDEKGSNWPDKPNDMLSWLIDEAPGKEKRNVYELTKRMLAVNFAAIHTSANSFTHALFHLAAEPEYIVPLREEVERVIAEEGWTKVAMTKMWKLDSFMKESQRMNGIDLLALNRKIMTDYTLSDGTFLPAGTSIASNTIATHSDEALYPNADKFDGFRFSNMRNEGAEEGVKHQMVNTSADYLAFGHGRHACPGRFFAVNELKAMMAYLLLTYDLKAEVEGVRPENVYMGIQLTPNPTAKVLLRKRADA